MSPLVKAGRMLRLLGWLFLALLLVIAFGYIIPLAHNGVAPTGTVLSKWGPQCAVMAVLTVGNLIAGARLKKEGTRANVIAGWVLAVFSLVIFPVGTVIGLFAIYYLVQGRSRAASAT
jgi:hypothetical protein